MKKTTLVLTAVIALCTTSCVSSKKLKNEQAKYAKLDSFYIQTQKDLQKCRSDEAEAARRRAQLETDLEAANKQAQFLRENNNTMVNQLKDLSVISSSQAESIKKSLENIGNKDIYIQDLQRAMARKDSLNMA